MGYLVGGDRAAVWEHDRAAVPGVARPFRSVAPRPADDKSALRRDPLADFLETSILPRVLAAHGLTARLGGERAATGAGIAFDPAAVVALALGTEADALLDHVDALLLRGASIDRLFVDLLAPAARHLGVLWEEDRCDFVEVTMGLWRLQEVVRELAARVPAGRDAAGHARHALFAAMPGDQHSFGTVLIDETFRRDGWRSEALLDPAAGELIDRVAGEWFDLIGLTVSCDCNIAPLPGLIHALRSVSRNPHVVVMVGGRVFVEDPALAAEVGANGTAADALGAVEVAGRLVGMAMLEVCTSG